MTRRARRLSVLLAIVVAVALAALAFRGAGRALVRVQPLAKADAIIILGSLRMERTLEAGQLYREGWAPRVVILRTIDLQRRGVLTRLGVTVPVYFDVQLSALRQMGVPASAIDEVRETTESTQGEARQMGDYAARRGYRRVIVVTSTYHTRRTSRYFRCLAGNVQTIMRSTRFDGADPAYWWQWPMDRADVLGEYMKWPKALMATMRCGA